MATGDSAIEVNDVEATPSKKSADRKQRKGRGENSRRRTKLNAFADASFRAAQLSELVRPKLDPLGVSIQRANELSVAMTRNLEPFAAISRQAVQIGEMISPRIDLLAESFRQTQALQERFRSLLEPFGESFRRAQEFQETLRSRVEPFGESIRRALELQESLRSRLEPFGESIRRTMFSFNKISSPSLDRFYHSAMAIAAAAVEVETPAAFAAVWRSPAISRFAERFLHDSEFNRELLKRLEAWQFDETEGDVPSGAEVLLAIDEAIESAGFGDKYAKGKNLAANIAEFWRHLPGDVRNGIIAFVVGVILLIIDHFIITPVLNPQEPAIQQRVRDQRKLARCATRELGVRVMDYRVTTRERLPVYCSHRRDAPRTGELELGHTVQIVQKNRNWCEVIWLDANGATRGGWVQTRYLRRL